MLSLPTFRYLQTSPDITQPLRADFPPVGWFKSLCDPVDVASMSEIMALRSPLPWRLPNSKTPWANMNSAPRLMINFGGTTRCYPDTGDDRHPFREILLTVHWTLACEGGDSWVCHTISYSSELATSIGKMTMTTNWNLGVPYSQTSLHLIWSLITGGRLVSFATMCWEDRNCNWNNGDSVFLCFWQYCTWWTLS